MPAFSSLGWPDKRRASVPGPCVTQEFHSSILVCPFVVSLLKVCVILGDRCLLGQDVMRVSTAGVPQPLSFHSSWSLCSGMWGRAPSGLQKMPQAGSCEILTLPLAPIPPAPPPSS